MIRDTIIGEIIDGTHPPGALLPSNSNIQQRWGVSARTSRRVLGELETAGWARSAGTRGYIATTGPNHEYHRHGGTDAYTDTHSGTHGDDAPTNIDPTDPGTSTGQIPPPGPAPGPSPVPAPAYTVPRPVHTVPLSGAIPADFATVRWVQVTHEPAPPDVAQALRLTGSGAPVTVRRRLLTDPAGQIPIELRTSYLANVASDHPLAQPTTIPEPWTHALAVHGRYALTTATSHIHARHPTDYEAHALGLPATAVVLIRATTLYGINAAPIDYTVAVWPADTTRIAADNHTIT